MKITVRQLKGLIRESVKQVMKEDAEKQQGLYQKLDTAETAISELIDAVEEVHPRTTTKFRGGEHTVNLHDVLNAIKINREIEQDAPEYGGGMYKMQRR